VWRQRRLTHVVQLISSGQLGRGLVSVTFYGKRLEGTAIMLDVEEPAYLNMANGNARPDDGAADLGDRDLAREVVAGL